MLRFEASSEVQQFREAFRSWLNANPPPQPQQGGLQPQDAALETFVGVGRDWQRRLASGSWLGVHWPKAFGGRGLPLIYEAVVQEELVRANSPQLLGLFGISMVGPILIDYGTEAQQKRFLSRILSGEDIWCQGFSETEAGSDLSALRTSAKRSAAKGAGDGFIVNGHKVWTSFAHVADWCFLLCKSFDGPTRYDGFTYLLVDMRSPGITVRPLRQMSGEAEFNEVLFEDVFVPVENIIGKEGDGWKIAISTLMYERVILTFARQLQSETLLRREILSRDLNQLSDSQLDQFASHVASLSACRALAYEHLLSYGSISDDKAVKSGGNDQSGAKLGRNIRPGPEGSLDKLSWTESFQELCKFILELDGKDGIFSEEDNPNMLRYLYSRGRSIAAGTSEIQRNIIAERLLGLPKGRLR